MYIAFYSENVDVVVVSVLAAWGGRDRCANKEWLTSWTKFSLLKKNGSEKKLFTIEAHPYDLQDIQYLWTFSHTRAP